MQRRIKVKFGIDVLLQWLLTSHFLHYVCLWLCVSLREKSCLSHSNLSNLSRSVCSRWHTTLQLMANDRMINGYVYARTHKHKNMWGRLMWRATVQTHTSTASVYHLLSKGLLFFSQKHEKEDGYVYIRGDSFKHIVYDSVCGIISQKSSQTVQGNIKCRFFIL